MVIPDSVPDIAAIVIISALSVFTVFAVFQYLGRYILTYRLSADRLLVALLGIPIFWIRYDAIAEVQRLRQVELLRDSALWFRSVRIGNRGLGDVVLIKKKQGFPGYVIVTPSDPGEFSRVIADKIKPKGNRQ